MEIGHLHSKLLGVSRIVPQLSMKLGVQCALLWIIPIFWFILIEAVINTFVAELSLPAAVVQVGPIMAIVIGLILYFVAFGFNVFHLRHDLITSQVAHSEFSSITYVAPTASRQLSMNGQGFERMSSASQASHDDLIVEESVLLEDDRPPARRSGSGTIRLPRDTKFSKSTSVYDDEEERESIFDEGIRPAVTLDLEDD